MSKGKFEISAIFRAIDNMTKPLRGMTMGISRFSKQIEKSLEGPHKALGRIDAGLRNIGKSVAVAGVAAGVGLTALGSAGANFEEAISAVGAVGLKTRGQIADLEKEALRLGSTTKFTATEAANAMEVMARAGFKNADILGSVGGVLSAAAAEGVGIAEVAEVVSASLNAFGLESNKAGYVADLLAVASTGTKSSIMSLGESMKNLAPVASQFGISIKDATAMVALLQDVGLDASEAGTATATMLTKLAKPADGVARTMKELGIAFKDAQGNMRPPVEIFEQMRTAASGLGGNMDKVAFFSDLVGLRGQKAALGLQRLFDTTKGKDFLDSLQDVTGAAGKMADLRLDNLKGDLTILSSTVEGLQVALFQTESGPLRGIVKGITEWVGANQGLIVSGFSDFMTSLKDSLPTIGYWFEKIGKLLLAFYAIRGITALVYGLAKAFAVLTAANPWVLLAYGLVTAAALIWTFWPEISAFFGRVWQSIKDFGANAWKAIAGFASRVWATLQGWGSKVLGFFGGLWNAVKGPLLGFATFYIGVWSFLLKPVVWLFGKLVELAKWAFAGLQKVWAPIGAWFAELWEGLVSGLSVVWDGIVSVAGSIISAIGDVLSAIGSVVSTAWESIAGTARGAYDTIVGVFSPLGEFFRGLWAGVSSAFQSALGWITDKMGGLAKLAGSIVGAVQGEGAQVLGVEDRPAGRTVNPNASVSREIKESVSTSKGEVTVVSDKPARVTKPAPGLRVRAPVPSGAF